MYSPLCLVIFVAVEGTFVFFTKGHDHFISNSIRCGCLRTDQCNNVTLAYRIGDKSEIRFLRERPSMFKMIKLTIFVFLHKSKLRHLIYSYPIAIYTNVASNVTFYDIIIDHC